MWLLLLRTSDSRGSPPLLAPGIDLPLLRGLLGFIARALGHGHSSPRYGPGAKALRALRGLTSCRAAPGPPRWIGRPTWAAHWPPDALRAPRPGAYGVGCAAALFQGSTVLPQVTKGSKLAIFGLLSTDFRGADLETHGTRASASARIEISTWTQHDVAVTATSGDQTSNGYS